MRLVVLAAGQGTRLGALTADRPKALVPLAGRPLLAWTLEAAASCGIRDVVVVGGHGIAHLAGFDVRLLENPAYASTNMVQTLFCAAEEFGAGFVMSYGDIAYDPSILRAVLDGAGPVRCAVDLAWRPYWEARSEDPLADTETMRLLPDGRIETLGGRPASMDEVQGQYIGLVAFEGAGVQALRDVFAEARDDAAAGRTVLGRRPSLRALYMTDVLDVLAGRGMVHAVTFRAGWVEIDRPEDIPVAEERWAERPSAARGAEPEAGA